MRKCLGSFEREQVGFAVLVPAPMLVALPDAGSEVALQKEFFVMVVLAIVSSWQWQIAGEVFVTIVSSGQ